MPRARKRVAILIADDHELVRRGVREVLRKQRDWKVAEARDGCEAVTKATELQPEIAILDITMPKLDGLEATRRIKSEAPETQVLVLTMHESDQMVCRVLEAGARGYVLKSDLAEHLVEAVREVLAGRTYLTPKASAIMAEGIANGSAKSNGGERESVPLTPREFEVLSLLADGKSNKQVAATLGMTVRTAETHRAKIMLKLGAHSLVELVHYAARHGISATGGN